MEAFALERYFDKYEFKTKYTLSASDCEAFAQNDLLAMADEECLNLWHNLKLHYTETLGHPLLLKAIADLYTSVSPRQLLVAAPEELIYLAIHALLAKGDEIIVTTPAYQSLHEIARSLGVVVQPWPLMPGGDGWHLDLDFLADHITDKTKLIIINFPHNPTGNHIPAMVQKAIIDVARKHGITIFSDEMYRGAEHRPSDQLPAMVDVYERGISLWGLSKSFGLPGLRIGWLASKDSGFLARCSGLRDYISICNSAPAEILGIIAVRQHARILERTRTLLTDNLIRADRFFKEHAGTFDWLRPKAGPVAFPALRTPVPIEQFCADLIERKSLLITPAALFQYSGNHFRFGLGRASFPEALSVLEDYLRSSKSS